MLFAVLIAGCGDPQSSTGDDSDDSADGGADDDSTDDDSEVVDDDSVDDDSAAMDDDSAVDDDSGADDDTNLTVKTLGWIRSVDGRIMDEFGRNLVFRGMNARVQGLFDGSAEWETAPAVYDESDAWTLANLGFNLLRLAINWSGLEPEEGNFSETYLQLMDQVVSMSVAAGVYVLIDFHQDKYSKFIGEDGAPRWAIIPPLPEAPEKAPMTLQILLAQSAYINNAENL